MDSSPRSLSTSTGVDVSSDNASLEVESFETFSQVLRDFISFLFKNYGSDDVNDENFEGFEDNVSTTLDSFYDQLKEHNLYAKIEDALNNPNPTSDDILKLFKRPLTKKPRALKAPTEKQLAQKAKAAEISQGWKSLSDEQKDKWTSRAEKLKMILMGEAIASGDSEAKVKQTNGYHYYVQYYNKGATWSLSDDADLEHRFRALTQTAKKQNSPVSLSKKSELSPSVDVDKKTKMSLKVVKSSK